MTFEHLEQRPTATDQHLGPKGPSPVLIGSAVVLTLAAILFFQNGGHTSIHVFGFVNRTTVRWSIITSIALGIVIDRLFTRWWRKRKHSRSIVNSPFPPPDPNR